MTTEPVESWKPERLSLERSLYVFLVVWVGGALVAVVGGFIENRVLFWGGAIVFLLSLIPYFVMLLHSYRLQAKLNEAQGNRSGAAWVILGGLILNPFILGVIIPALVLRSERNVRARLSHPSGHGA